METKITLILLRKETKSKFTKIASLCVMISNYALVDTFQVPEIILVTNILKYHHGMTIKKYFLFPFFARSHVYEETKTKSVYISHQSSMAQKRAR